MNQPTEQQIEAAAKHAVKIFPSRSWQQIMREVAPMLQVAWEPITDAEWDWSLSKRSNGRIIVNEFIAARNAALQPKPVDERIEKIYKIIASAIPYQEEVIRAIATDIAALDKAKLAVE